MPGIVVGEVSSASNPLLPFIYQEDGFLTAPYSVAYNVVEVATGTSKKSGSLDLVADAVVAGVYALPLDPSALALAAGAYEARWSYKASATGPTLYAGYTFEVLSATYFRPGRGFTAYVPSSLPSMAAKTVQARQAAIERASREVERITRRHFFPRYMQLDLQCRPESRCLSFGPPVIALESITLLTDWLLSSPATSYEMDLSSLRVYNRHLRGLLSPDDRQDPKVCLAPDSASSLASLFQVSSSFPEGYMNLRVKGVFGLTEADGGPFGMVPLPLQEVVEVLALRYLRPVSAIPDPFMSQSGRVKSAKTRDQAITLDTSVSAYSIFTGDPRLDSILMDYMPPAHVGVAG